jgi:hypothetical protein
MTRVAFLRPILYTILVSNENLLELFQLKLVHSSWLDTIVNYLRDECIKYSRPRYIDIGRHLQTTAGNWVTSRSIMHMDLKHYRKVSFIDESLRDLDINLATVFVKVVSSGIEISQLSNHSATNKSEVVLVKLTTPIADLFDNNWLKIITKKRTNYKTPLTEREIAICLLQKHNISDFLTHQSLTPFVKNLRISLIMNQLYVLKHIIRSQYISKENLVGSVLVYGSGEALLIIDSNFTEKRNHYLEQAKYHGNKRLVEFLERDDFCN